ncbi:serine hydrolase domain-containing protein [Actinomadura rupiterrae]|uniref:serine hydrolase domain-containing protein n=1 Tax=Actinomadura rupiterrae TaxID=559627 RepID=UPI0020A527D8|nr:serine hydrolase domain-containing protein [Actinomadura rupiterrae]MCP2340143.1 D-alanyl-D-alanine carboxypeptidase [Actinomadura rupiterrae]
MLNGKSALGGTLALAIGGSLALGALVSGTAHASSGRFAAATSKAPSGPLQDALDQLTKADGAPGALLEARDRRGRTALTSGVADVQNGAPMRSGSRFRIGSMTKMFTATVMLQLVGEGRVALDAPVERYLPGVVRGADNDGREITVRQVLQHTSGLPDYVALLDQKDIVAHPLAHHDARDLLNLALSRPRTFKPGDGWRYSNTGYLVAGMIIERVTGRPYGAEVRRRVIAPLGLRDTSVPGDRTEIAGRHPRGYVRPSPDGPLVDITSFNPSVAGAGGGMVSSTRDLDRFLGALVRGKLLRPAELRQMMATRLTGDSGGRAYGLGLESRELPCGGLYWGHSGDIFGFQTMGGATSDGRQASVMANLDPGGSRAQSRDMRTALETALCTPTPPATH